MSKTTLLRKASDITPAPNVECHGGTGSLVWSDVLNASFLEGRRLKFLHDNILKPGVSIGVHEHKDDEEYYYIISGRGIMTLDGQEHEVETGDIAAVFSGGSHGLANAFNEDLRIVVFCVS